MPNNYVWLTRKQKKDQMNQNNQQISTQTAEVAVNPLLQPNFTFANAPAEQQKRFKFHNPVSKKAMLIGASAMTAVALVTGTIISVSTMQADAKQAKIQRESRVVVL